MRPVLRLFYAAITLFAFAQAGMADDRIPIFVSIVPQKYFVQQIGRDLVDVQVMVQPGASPHNYEPKPGQMAGLAKTKIYFAIGVQFENAWLEKIAAVNPDMQVVHTDQGIQKITMAADHHHHGHAEKHHEEGHAHEEQARHEAPHEALGHASGHHEHAGTDPHIWLSPPMVKVQARTILAALQQADPAHRSVYETNFREFAAKIDQLDADLKNSFKGKKGLQFMVFHPAWGCFAQAYGLKQVPIELEGKAPKPAQLKTLIQHARASGIKVIFVQPQFSTKSADLVAREIEGQVIFADPLAAEWMANLRQVADQFQAALK